MFPGVGMPTHPSSFFPEDTSTNISTPYLLSTRTKLDPVEHNSCLLVSLNFCHLFTQIWWRELVTREHVFTADSQPTIAYHKISRIYVDVQI